MTYDNPPPNGIFSWSHQERRAQSGSQQQGSRHCPFTYTSGRRAGVFAARALFGAELIALSPSLSSEGGYILPKPECLFTKLGEIHSKHIYMTLYPVCMTCAHSKKRTLPISNLVVLGWLVAVMAGGSLKALVGSSSSGGGGCTGVLLPDMYYHLDCLCHIIPSRTNVSCSGFPEAYV